MFKNSFYILIFLFFRGFCSYRTINEKYKGLIKYIENSKFLFFSENREISVNSADIYFKLSCFYDEFFRNGNRLLLSKKNLNIKNLEAYIKKINEIGKIYEDIVYERSIFFTCKIINNNIEIFSNYKNFVGKTAMQLDDMFLNYY